MEILKHGSYYRKPVSKEYIYQCPECGCVISLNDEELKDKRKYAFSEDFKNAYCYLECPECSYHMLLKKNIDDASGFKFPKEIIEIMSKYIDNYFDNSKY